jgi:hypothetical protein
LKSKAELSDHDVNLLLRVCSGVASREAYKTWNAGQPVHLLGFAEQEWTPRDLFQKFQAYALASFFELLQPGSVYWKGPNPNVEQMETVPKILHSLPRAPGDFRKRAIKAFVEGRTDLAGMHRILKLKLKHSPQALQLIWANRDFGPKAFREKLCAELENFDIKLSSKPSSYPKQIERLKQEAEAFVKSL